MTKGRFPTIPFSQFSKLETFHTNYFLRDIYEKLKGSVNIDIDSPFD